MYGGEALQENEIKNPKLCQSGCEWDWGLFVSKTVKKEAMAKYESLITRTPSSIVADIQEPSMPHNRSIEDAYPYAKV